MNGQNRQKAKEVYQRAKELLSRKHRYIEVQRVGNEITQKNVWY